MATQAELKTRPVRVQLSRAKGWRMPPNTVKVDRTTKWGNPFNFKAPEHCWTALAYGEKGDPAGRHSASVKAFREWMRTPAGMRLEGCGLYAGTMPIAVAPVVEALTPPDPSELRGKNLACWCKPDQPCHADVLLELANAPNHHPEGSTR
jgi:hypothetical protein